jgi:Lipase.
MPSEVFEPSTPASERPQIHVLDRETAGTGKINLGCSNISLLIRSYIPALTTLTVFFTGLDPAGPLFTKQSCEVRLCKGDAEFTEVVHTNGNPISGLGTQNEDGRNANS